jgi:microcystin-dependent protein
MSEPFIGQIVMFAGNFAPRGWAFCDGQLLAISQYSALFSILGTTYGGDGRTTFALPDLRGRVAMHAGNGPGLSNRPLGTRGGAEEVTLNINQIPSHSHGLAASSAPAADTSPSGNLPAETRRDAYVSGSPNTTMATAAISNTGGSQAHTNVQPYTVVNYIIALQGIFPSRS